MRRAARRDENDATITHALRQAGFVVYDYASVGAVPDKLATKALPDGTAWICWVEIKTPKGRLTQSQETFKAVFAPRGEFYVAREAEETVRELTDRWRRAIKPEHCR